MLFLVVWCAANHKKRVLLNINNSTLEITSGNIFDEKGFKVIAFNEFFDTQVDDIVISKNTLNGNYITHFYPHTSELDQIISKDAHSSKQIIGKPERKNGKTIKYRLGTIIKNEDYFLLAFTHFDEDNRAFLGVDEYIECLMNMWNECDIHYGGKTIIFPLLGSGITRFRNYESMTDQELLEIMIWMFKVSHIQFQKPEKVKIVLTNECLRKINLYSIEKRYK